MPRKESSSKGAACLLFQNGHPSTSNPVVVVREALDACAQVRGAGSRCRRLDVAAVVFWAG
jgi:hypothetical protein